MQIKEVQALNVGWLRVAVVATDLCTIDHYLIIDVDFYIIVVSLVVSHVSLGGMSHVLVAGAVVVAVLVAPASVLVTRHLMILILMLLLIMALDLSMFVDLM